MEPTSTVYPMPSLENLRRGQAQICERFRDGLLETVAKLPTGYGKTKAAAVSFGILLAMNVADVMVVVVPSIGQATQAAEDIPRELKDCGSISTGSCIVGNAQQMAVQMAKSGAAKVFIVTVQSLMGRGTPSALNSILGGKRTFLVIDEHHHYGATAAWAREVLKIKHAAFLAMSATPDRKAEAPLFGQPHISISYRDAADAGYVKPLHLSAYDYRVDFVIDGGISSFSISELIAEAGDSPDSIEKWAAAREARWTPKYVSPLISHPVERLIALYADERLRTQMIVYALCCSHAKVVCDQIKYLVPAGMTVDWVGSGPNGRSDDENEQGLHSFCPPKDAAGRRPWTLDVLVCVGMGSEGLDICEATEGVWLTSPGIHNTSKQQIGRLSRVVKGHPELIGHVNMDAASAWAPFTGQKVMAVLDASDDEPPEEQEEGTERQRPEGAYKPIPPGPIIHDVELIEIRSDPKFVFIKDEVKDEYIQGGHDELDADRIAEDAALRYMRRADERFNQTYQQANARKLLDARVRKVAGLALRIATQRGQALTRDAPGDFVKRINSAKIRIFGPVEGKTPAQVQLQNEWVRELEAALLRGEVPTWL